MSKQMPEACPYCGAGISILEDGRECRAIDNTSAQFACLTSWHKDYPSPRRLQSLACERIERNNLIAERDRLRDLLATLEAENKGLVARVAELEARCKRLEELGAELRVCAGYLGWTSSDDSDCITRAERACEAWDKEAKP